jgi:hypothetical protein
MIDAKASAVKGGAISEEMVMESGCVGSVGNLLRS